MMNRVQQRWFKDIMAEATQEECASVLNDRIAELEAQLAEVNADATRWQNRWIEADKQLAELAKQEPVARATGYYGGRSVVEALNPAAIIPVGMALYAAPMPVVQQEPVANVFSCRYVAELRIYSSQVHSYLPLASGDSLYAAPVVPDGMAKLRNIASIAHCGGLVGMSVSDALTAVRRATLPYFDTEATEEQHRAMIAAAQENAAMCGGRNEQKTSDGA